MPEVPELTMRFRIRAAPLRFPETDQQPGAEALQQNSGNAGPEIPEHRWESSAQQPFEQAADHMAEPTDFSKNPSVCHPLSNLGNLSGK